MYKPLIPLLFLLLPTHYSFSTSTDPLMQTIIKLANDAFDAGKACNLEKKRRLLGQSISICQTNEMEDVMCAYVYQHQGGVYYRLGDYELARMNYEESVSICEKIGEDNIRYRSLTEMASLHKEYGDFNKAIEAYYRLLEMDLPPDLDFLIKGNIGQTLIESGAVHEGVDILLNIPLDHPEVSGNLKYGVCNALAWSYADLSDLDKATAYYEKARELAEPVFGKNSRELGKIINGYANNLLLSKGQCQEAAQEFQLSLKGLLPQFAPLNIFENPSREIIGSENTIMEALLGKARALKCMFQKDANPQYLKSALECYHLIAFVENRLRRTYFFESAKLNLQADSHLRMEEGISIAYLLYQLEQKPQYVIAALNLMENSRALILLEALNELERQAISGSDSSFLELKAVKEKIKFNQLNINDLHRYPDSDREQILLEGKKTLEKRLQELLKDIEYRFPEYYSEKYKPAVIDSIALSEYFSLNEESAIVEYFLGEQESFVIGITATGHSFIPLDFLQKDEVLVKEFLENLVSRGNIQIYKQKAYDLYNRLVLPLKKTGLLPLNVAIVPDGIISFLPFDALITADDNYSNAKDYPFLFKKHVFSFGFSLSTLLKKQNRQTENLKPYLGIAPVQYDKHASLLSLIELPYSLDEIGLGRKLFKGDSITYSNARKNLFKTKASHYRILHFSTHASSGDSIYKNPWISFADSLMLLPEVYTLDLNARLVILSSCEASLGELKYGEGAFSIARGFAFSGCPSITTTLWSVRQRTTSAIISKYLAYLDKGMPKNMALYKAKEAYLENSTSNFAHPYYWAGIIQVGEISSIKERNQNGLIGIAISALFAFMALGYWREKRKKQLFS